MLRLAPCAVLLAAVLLAACREDAPTRAPDRIDPQLVEMGDDGWAADLDGGPSLLRLGNGWQEPAGGRVRATQSAVLYFPPPDFEEHDAEIVARVRPLLHENVPRQSFVPLLNGEELPPVELPGGWQEVRFPLPAEHLRTPLNALELRFAAAAWPPGVEGAGRPAAAVLARIAVVRPGGEPPPRRPAAGVRTAPRQLRLPAPSKDRPHVFVYLVDTLRADVLEPYGADGLSPHVRRFADDAVVFERAWSAAPWTGPAVASIMTGLYPHKHGFTTGRIRRRPTRDVPTLAERLRELGYETLGISQSYLVSDIFGLSRGFEHFYLNDTMGFRHNRSDEVRWYLWRHLLDGAAVERPLFTYLHTMAPHQPYTPEGEDRRFAEAHPGNLPPELYTPQDFMWKGLASPEENAHLKALYDGEVLYADREFGAFVDLLKMQGLYDGSFVVLTSDHGEEFYEHGGFDHGRTLFEELLHVPLIVKFPDNWKGGTRVRARVSTMDLGATLFDDLGEEADRSLDGRSFLDLVRDGGERGRQLFAETSPGGTKFAEVTLSAAIAGDVKCIFSKNGVDRFGNAVPAVRAFDLASDPGEQTPLAAEDGTAEDSTAEDSTVARCAAALRSWVAAAEAAGARSDDADAVISDDVRERLKALGYLD